MAWHHSDDKAFSFKKMNLKLLSAKWHPFHPSLNIISRNVWLSDIHQILKLPRQLLRAIIVWHLNSWISFQTVLTCLTAHIYLTALLWWYLSNKDLVTTWISYYIYYDVWVKITYSFPKFNGATVEVWEWLSNFIPHFTWHVVTYPCLCWNRETDWNFYCNYIKSCQNYNIQYSQWRKLIKNDICRYWWDQLQKGITKTIKHEPC